MTEKIHFERIESNVLTVTGDYQCVYEHCTATLVELGGDIKKEDMSAGILEAAWWYGINPFGLRATLSFRVDDNGVINVIVKANFKDSFTTTGAPEKKVQEIMKALLGADVTSDNHTVMPPSLSAAPINSHRNKTKGLMALAAFVFGGMGGHKFYAGCWGWGLVYLVSCFILPFVSLGISMIEFIRILTLSPEKFNQKYNTSEPKPFTFIW